MAQLAVIHVNYQITGMATLPSDSRKHINQSYSK